MRLALLEISYRYTPDSPWLFQKLSAGWGIGQVGALTGPSGSGKSTLLDVLGGVRRATVGNVSLDADGGNRSLQLGVDPTCFSWVLQNNTVLSGRTVEDNVGLTLVSKGFTYREARVLAREALEQFGLGDKGTMMVDDLSGGEVQRVTIARCLLSSAPVVLADEPTGQLDAQNTQIVADALSSAAKAGKIVIVATHDPQVVMLCDTVLDLRSQNRG
jgi:ABC-type lipoprotein export system ATPase subunit